MKKFRFELGDKVKDTLTGLEGILTYRVEYLTGCNQYGMFTGLDDKGEIRKDHQVDENRLELIEEAHYKIPITENKVEVQKPGGPQTYVGK